MCRYLSIYIHINTIYTHVCTIAWTCMMYIADCYYHCCWPQHAAAQHSCCCWLDLLLFVLLFFLLLLLVLLVLLRACTVATVYRETPGGREEQGVAQSRLSLVPRSCCRLNAGRCVPTPSSPLSSLLRCSTASSSQEGRREEVRHSPGFHLSPQGSEAQRRKVCATCASKTLELDLVKF